MIAPGALRIAAVAIAALVGFGGPAAAGCALPANAASLMAAAGEAMNAQRQGNGRAPLGRDPRLDQAAQGHACWMAQTGKFSHKGAGGSQSKRRIESAGYHGMVTAENIAWGEPTASALISDWMSSSKHRSNILLGRTDDYGIGVAILGGRPVWVMVFAGT